MNSFDRFQERNKIRAKSTDRGNASFIVKGYNSTLITSGTTRLQAAVVNEQEKDSAYVYTRISEPLTIGSSWEAKSLHLLITEEIVVIKDVDWHKYKAEVCNVELDGVWGRFIGPEAYVNIALKEKVTLVSQQKPLIILPDDTLHFGDVIVIKGRPWVVQEYDSLSVEGITYYSLAPTTVSKEILEDATADSFIVSGETAEYEVTNGPTQQTDLSYKVQPNVDITLATENGYFKYNNDSIVIKKRTATSVVFNLPFGVKEVTVQIKEAGVVVSKTYRQI